MNIQIHREELLKQIGYKEPPQPRLLEMVDEVLGLLEELFEPKQAFKKSRIRKIFLLFSLERFLNIPGQQPWGRSLKTK